MLRTLVCVILSIFPTLPLNTTFVAASAKPCGVPEFGHLR
jgi:hypothetical protein